MRVALFVPEYRASIEAAYPAAAPILAEEMTKAQRFKHADTATTRAEPKPAAPKHKPKAQKLLRPPASDVAAATATEEPEKPLNIKKPVVDLDRVFRNRKGVTA